MPIINDGLLEPVYQAILNDPYDAGDSDISVTRLINPPRIVELFRRHNGSITIKASSRLWATYGQLMHLLLERVVNSNPALKERYLTENRMFREIDGWKVSGQFDLYDKQKNTLYDYKFVGAFAVKMAKTSGREEWEQQLNLLRYLFFKENGILPERIAIGALVRDFSERNLKEGILPTQEIDFPVWDINKAEYFLHERVNLHQMARALPDSELELCSDEERWYRSGKNARCEKYCDVSQVCDFAKSLKI